jgi:hypothetical protein
MRRKPLYAHEAAVCGSIAGGVAAAITTPLDVLKTRVMLDMRVGFHPTSLHSDLNPDPLTGRNERETTVAARATQGYLRIRGDARTFRWRRSPNAVDLSRGSRLLGGI